MTTNQNSTRIALDNAYAKYNALYWTSEDIKSRIDNLDVNNYADSDYNARREALVALEAEMVERCNAAWREVKAAENAYRKAHMMTLPFFADK